MWPKKPSISKYRDGILWSTLPPRSKFIQRRRHDLKSGKTRSTNSLQRFRNACCYQWKCLPGAAGCYRREETGGTRIDVYDVGMVWHGMACGSNLLRTCCGPPDPPGPRETTSLVAVVLSERLTHSRPPVSCPLPPSAAPPVLAGDRCYPATPAAPASSLSHRYHLTNTCDRSTRFPILVQIYEVTASFTRDLLLSFMNHFPLPENSFP